MRGFHYARARLILAVIVALAAILLAINHWAFAGPSPRYTGQKTLEGTAAELGHKIYFPVIFYLSDHNSVVNPPGEPGDPGGPGGPGESEEPGPLPEQGTGFEIDGNTAYDWQADYDWETVARPPAVWLADPHSKGTKDLTVFHPNGKFEQPERWNISSGSVGPPQTELTNLAVWMVRPEELGPNKPSGAWLILGMERTKKEGSFFLDFEFNQAAWDGRRGGPDRQPGDISVGFAIHGNPDSLDADISLHLIQYQPDKQPAACQVSAGAGGKPEVVLPGSEPCPPFGDSGWYYRFLGSSAELAASGIGEAAMNEAPFAAPWPSFDEHGDPRNMIGPFQFAEAAINLEALEIELSCSTWSSVHAKGRASLQPGSDLKDLAGPVSLATNCRLEGHKFLDVSGDGTWDMGELPLAGWTMSLNNGQTTQTDAKGWYQFEWLEDGQYEVGEKCPADWAQTTPGMTGVADCGKATYKVDINIDNHDVRDLDFGNGRPEIGLSLSCPAAVFLGDSLECQVAVKNLGNVDLRNIKVEDGRLGQIGQVDLLSAGQKHEFSYSQKVIEKGTWQTVVKAIGYYGLAQVSASAKANTTVYGLTVTKTALPSLDRHYRWTIDKEVANPGPIIILRGRAIMATYTVTVGLDVPAFTEANPTISGSITVVNPAPMEAHLSQVTDILEPGISLDVSCPSLTIPGGGQVVCEYGPVSLNNTNHRMNKATATLMNNNGDTTDFSDTAEVDFSKATFRVVDGIVDITDNRAGSLGSVSYSEGSKEFGYQKVIGPYADVCGDVFVENVAKYVARDSGATGQDQATVNLFIMCVVRVGFEDLPIAAGNDWDYNDLVVDVDVGVTLSGDLTNPDLEAVHLKITRLTGYPEFSIRKHELHIAPHVFECDGTYVMRTYTSDSNYTEKSGPYSRGQDFLVLSEEGKPPKRVELDIFFDVPPEGCPCNQEVLGDPLNTFHGESLFFNPWMRSWSNNVPEDVVTGDSRMLAVPDLWQWPNEKQAIWKMYPKVIPGKPPTFVPRWWLP